MGPRDRGPPKKGLMRTGIRGVAGGVGLASESVKACKDGRTGKTNPNVMLMLLRIQPSTKIPVMILDMTLRMSGTWTTLRTRSLTIRRRILFLTLANWKMHFFADIYRPTTSGMRSQGKMPLPLVLLQRKPKDRSRGFIRAFAPVLENCGINQAAWLVFLDAFQKSSAASPWFNAINMASIGTIFTPHMIGLVVGHAIQQATNMAIELQARES